MDIGYRYIFHSDSAPPAGDGTYDDLARIHWLSDSHE